MRALAEGAYTESQRSGSSTTPSSVSIAAEERRGLPKVSSGLNIAAVYQEQKDGQIAQKEIQFTQDFESKKGFDLK